METSLLEIGRKAASAIIAYALVVSVVKAGLIAAGLPSTAAEFPGGAPLDKLFELTLSAMRALGAISGTTVSPEGVQAAGILIAAAFNIALYVAFMALFGYIEIAIWLMSHVPPQYAYYAAMLNVGLAILQLAVIRWIINVITGR